MTKSKSMAAMVDTHAQWSSSWVFVLAASGAAIGLNNVWQFPFLVSDYGGGAFIIVYIFCVLLIGAPLLIAEVMLGRRGRASPVSSIRRLAEHAGRHPAWGAIGWLGVGAGFLILSYLSVIAGWIMAYAARAAIGALDGLTAEGMGNLFTTFVADPEKQMLWHTLFIVMTMFVVGRGIKAGLEPVIKYSVPLLFVLFKLTRLGILAAAGHAFFSLGLGVGAMLIYGAYLHDDASIPKLALIAAGIDTLAGVIGGLVVLSVVFAGGMEPVSRAELIFQALPMTFDQLPFGRAMATLFFISLVIAAWLSGIALIEPLMAWLNENWGLSRARSAAICGVGAWLVGLTTVLSFNYWGFSFKVFGAVKRLGFFDLLQILTSGLLLPLSGLLMALFAGWLLTPELTRAELRMRSPCAYDLWLWSVRLIMPVLLFLVFFNAPRLFL
jgi:NSS family neurotransmitter:Na+ symporter